jgi:aryl-alcohol dehydrogenase-like predicted oxidoreductase
MSDMMLGKSGLRVPRLGVGAMTWGDEKQIPRWNPARLSYGLAEGGDEQQKALDISLAAGANLIDTAAFYGKGASEKRVGELARGKTVLLATKYPMKVFSGAGRLPDDLEGSLARLQRQTIDLYQIHFPSPWRPIPKLMHLLADAVKAGKVRAVGVSNYSARQMREAHAVLASRGIPLASNQVQYSLLHRTPEVDGVLDACHELGVTLIAYQPLASGALTGKYSLSNPPNGLRKRSSLFSRETLVALGPVIELLQEIGARYDKSPAQVALRWLIEKGALPIPGAKNSTQAAQNAGALSFSLTAEEVDVIDKATMIWRK